jgi:two-component system, response regulator PdtaR
MISPHIQLVPSQLWLAAAPPHGGDDPKEQDIDPNLGTHSLRVLIVEDEFFISLDMQNMLQALGHVVVGTAVSADEALRVAQRERPDIALVDIRLVGSRDGIEAAEEILRSFGVRSLFVTANADPDTRARAQAVQPLGFLEKPVTVERLKGGLRGFSSS